MSPLVAVLLARKKRLKETISDSSDGLYQFRSVFGIAIVRTHLTDIAVRALKPGDKQYKVWDASFPGFGVRVNGKSKSWVVMHGADRRLKVLGRYPDVSLKDARVSASRHLLRDPESAEEKPPSLQEAYDTYASAHCDANLKPSTAKETKRLLTRHLLPRHRHRAITEISKSDCTAIFDGLLNKPSAANHAFTAIRGFFSWATDRELVEVSPCNRLKIPAKTASRERVLTEKELSYVLAAARDTEYPFGVIVQLLILTGQRRGEIAALRWEWIDEKEQTILLPVTITKNKREHLIPYGAKVAALIETIPRTSEYLFPAQRERRAGKPATTFAGWSKPKKTLDAKIRGDLKRSPVAPWTLHDLRRTASTLWASLKVPQHINDRLLNHVTGSKQSRVARIYNRYEYLDEKREALVTWEEFVTTLFQRDQTGSSISIS
jgi:integrase